MHFCLRLHCIRRLVCIECMHAFSFVREWTCKWCKQTTFTPHIPINTNTVQLYTNGHYRPRKQTRFNLYHLNCTETMQLIYWPWLQCDRYQAVYLLDVSECRQIHWSISRPHTKLIKNATQRHLEPCKSITMENWYFHCAPGLQMRLQMLHFNGKATGHPFQWTVAEKITRGGATSLWYCALKSAISRNVLNKTRNVIISESASGERVGISIKIDDFRCCVYCKYQLSRIINCGLSNESIWFTQKNI